MWLAVMAIGNGQWLPSFKQLLNHKLKHEYNYRLEDEEVKCMEMREQARIQHL